MGGTGGLKRKGRECGVGSAIWRRDIEEGPLAYTLGEKGGLGL